MPRKKNVPSYCHHRASGQAYVKIAGRRIYLGKHGTPESHKRYREELGRWQAAQDTPPTKLSIGELTLLYFDHAQKHYVKDGKPTSKLSVIRAAIRALNQQFRQLPATELTPRRFKAVRETLIKSDLCRGTINDYMAQIRRMVKWAVGEELLPYEKLGALTAVRDLQSGRTEARESDPVQPVSLPDVEAVLPLLSFPLQGAIQFQLATAARPGETLQLRLKDIDRGGEVWLYRPDSHKTAHHGKDRIILCGPRAQAVVMEHAKADPEAFVFAVPGSNGTKPYRRDNYTLAIRRGCERVFNMPEELRTLKKDAPQKLKDEARKWRLENVWKPNMLRHTAATLIRREAGVEAAQTILGHSDLSVTEIYAERNLGRAAEIIARIG